MARNVVFQAQLSMSVPRERPAVDLELSAAAPSRGSIVRAFSPKLESPRAGADQAAICSTSSTWSTGWRDLFTAIANGEDSFFELLTARGLSLGSDTDSSDVEDAQTSRGDSIDVARVVDANGRTLLHQACRCGNVQAAKCLLFHGASPSVRCPEGRTPFHEATASSAALELLQLLFTHDPTGIGVADVNGSRVLHLAAIHGKLDVLQWCAGLRAPRPSEAATDDAATSGMASATPYLLPLHATSWSGRNVLHYAAYNGRLRVLQWLLSAENPRREELALGTLDANGYSVLHYAAMGAPLRVCEWLVLDAPSRLELSLTARTNEGKDAVELAAARSPAIAQFLADAARVPSVPCGLCCIGADATTLGVAWHVEPASQNARLDEVLQPLYFHLEVCKKPASLSRASGFLTMLLLMPSSPGSPRTPVRTSELASSKASSYLLDWEPLGVLLQPEAREHWLCDLERDTEYLVRMRARNRNGFSGYSVPNLTGAFTTAAGIGSRRASLTSLQRFFSKVQEPSPTGLADSFIGNLHLELLEARDLPEPHTPRWETCEDAALGQYYAVISVETPCAPEDAADKRIRKIYCVRTPLARLQQDMVLSGSPQPWRHPRFALRTTFRVPEAVAQTHVTVAIHHETKQQRVSCCVGRLSLSLVELVRGLPAKMQWLSLTNAQNSKKDGGLLLIRTLFLADGISELPHPNAPEVYGSTAEELLSTPPPSCGSVSSMSPPTSSSSCSSWTSQPPQALPTVDRLGFRVFAPENQFCNGEWLRVQTDQGVVRSYTYYQLLTEALEMQQERQWCRCRSQLLVETQTNDSSVCTQHEEIRELVWRGIPASRRPELYSRLSGARCLQANHPFDYFQRLLQRLEDPEVETVQDATSNSRFAAAQRQIHVDLQRTFAGHEQCWLASPAGQRALERVLLAYALHNDALGYCQSMTFVAGRLLCLCQAQSSMSTESDADLPLEELERVFWLLAVLCEELFPSYYTPGMTGLQVDGGVLEMLIQQRLPKLYHHFQQLHAPPMGLLLVTQWLLPMGCASFPSETTFRFLDVLFLEGSSVAFAVALALLRVSQHELLAEHVDYTQLFRFLRARDQRLHDASLLLEVARHEHQTLASEIAPLRTRIAGELEAERALEITTKTHTPTSEAETDLSESRPPTTLLSS